MAKGDARKARRLKRQAGRGRPLEGRQCQRLLPKPKEEAAPEVVVTKPVVKPSIGLSDIGRLAKSAIGGVLALMTPKSQGRKRTAIKSEKSAKPVKSRR